MVNDVTNSESAQRILDLLNKAKETIVATIETVAASPMAQASLAKLQGKFVHFGVALLLLLLL